MVAYFNLIHNFLSSFILGLLFFLAFSVVLVNDFLSFNLIFLLCFSTSFSQPLIILLSPLFVLYFLDITAIRVSVYFRQFSSFQSLFHSFLSSLLWCISFRFSPKSSTLAAIIIAFIALAPCTPFSLLVYQRTALLHCSLFDFFLTISRHLSLSLSLCFTRTHTFILSDSWVVKVMKSGSKESAIQLSISIRIWSFL